MQPTWKSDMRFTFSITISCKARQISRAWRNFFGHGFSQWLKASSGNDTLAWAKCVRLVMNQRGRDTALVMAAAVLALPGKHTTMSSPANQDCIDKIVPSTADCVATHTLSMQ
eukprot:362200-Chlamydomonas_euryale.AAC.4